jgi:hypothetical protein
MTGGQVGQSVPALGRDRSPPEPSHVRNGQRSMWSPTAWAVRGESSSHLRCLFQVMVKLLLVAAVSPLAVAVNV